MPSLAFMNHLDSNEQSQPTQPKHPRVPIKTIDAPFGAWPMDHYAPKSPPTKPIHSSTTALVDIIDDKDVKYIWEGDLEHELRMMLFAGPECAIQPLGRVFKAPERINGYIPKEKMIGFVMPLEKVLVSGWSFDNPGKGLELTREERRGVIEMLIK
ncbi:hypothetical protein JAAARDRAFT_199166 [Jaapia argillacea MUCL 33604]|uniref:Uncharacterized protein n=1 Tax=Jaapia argillacea MUCL 33604 TaxID=933084 RepID=A0A067PLJ6_9AGAM|nr:hypothetical protein JAAARDRAFT_199166 [Jaapia argillacea MUCL 33604]